MDRLYNRIESSLPIDQPADSKKSRRHVGKKSMWQPQLFAAIIILTATFFSVIPQSNGNILPLDVKYNVGEKLTYDITTSTTLASLLTENTTTTVTEKSTLTIQVVSFDGQTYTLNYTTTSSLGDLTETTSHIATVSQSEMITFFSLLPVAIQGAVSEAARTTNQTNPVLSAAFNQTEKV